MAGGDCCGLSECARDRLLRDRREQDAIRACAILGVLQLTAMSRLEAVPAAAISSCDTSLQRVLVVPSLCPPPAAGPARAPHLQIN